MGLARLLASIEIYWSIFTHGCLSTTHCIHKLGEWEMQEQLGQEGLHKMLIKEFVNNILWKIFFSFFLIYCG